MKFLNECNELKHIIAVNECEATAICTGYHLATGKTGVVYLQNSGEGKAINPLVSLCDPEVYSIPVLLMIGWRGRPEEKDEPQHKKMGRVMLSLLDALEIPYAILEDDVEKIEKAICKAKEYLENKNAPYALIITKELIGEYETKPEKERYGEMVREEVIKIIVDSFDGSEVVISTTGKTSRELFEYREVKKQGHQDDFYTVGSMGCAASIAFGIASQRSEKKVFVFDGDGAVLMEMGSLATIGHYSLKNFYHIIIDNASYESTGGQPTVSPTVSFDKIALACGYKRVAIIKTKEDLIGNIEKIRSQDGPVMLIVKVNKGSRKDLGRPTITPIENKKAFMLSLIKKCEIL
ncbi:MAG: phosphonopyruvate decarboxylase [Firmicutes bacterium HGW-Firmicutes-13]|nr:MAG: phosphonopyruvate decarboxylase [Firmicutes bacterium HGW-Firmicutes-13]